MIQSRRAPNPQRAIRARRAAVAGRVSTPNRTATPLRGITETAVAPGYVRRSKALPMTGAMRSGDGAGVSAWARPAVMGGRVAAVTRDRRWDQTVQRQEA